MIISQHIKKTSIVLPALMYQVVLEGNAPYRAVVVRVLQLMKVNSLPESEEMATPFPPARVLPTRP
jgi:hypothetical protein